VNSALRRVGSAISPLALLVALLALVAGSAGLGYAAGQIGTGDIKNNAITAKKIKKNAVTTKKIKKNAVPAQQVKDGSLTVADLAPNEVQKPVVLGNGGEGDCVWQSGATLIAGLGAPTFRKDRFGAVRLSGVAVSSNGGGGDALCNATSAGQSADSIAFVLPAGYIPAKTQLVGGGLGAPTVIVGPQGLVTGTLTLPAGAVATLSSSSSSVVLDGVEFEPVGSGVVIPKLAASGRVSPELLAQLGIG